jgi:ABC-type transport system involved in cytochrome c biogenesis permease subunit
MNRVTIICFLASYGLALGLELLHLWRGRVFLRVLALLTGAGGLLAHTLYLYARQPPLLWQFSWMLFVAWVLAVFYLCGSLHYRRFNWGVFVLPLLLGLVGLGLLFGTPPTDLKGLWQQDLQYPHRLWAPVHAGLILLASIGVCVGFLASLMYLLQAHRLRAKTPPGRGLRLLSLERLEMMNRRAILLAFPLLTAGVLAGVVLLVQGSDTVTWADPRVLATLVLWAVFALLMYLRFAQHLRARQVAMLTIAAFIMLLCCLIISHPLPEGG